MKKRLLLLALPVAMVTAACAPGAGAILPATSTVTDATSERVATVQPSGGDRLAAAQGTAAALTTTTSRPQATATSSSVSPVNPVPAPTSASGPNVNAPRPMPTATRQPTATPVRFDPNATPTPLWSSPPRPFATATPTRVPLGTPYVPPTIVAAAPGEQFNPQLNYSYTLSPGWSEVRTESSIILHDASGKIRVTITEKVTEPWKFPTAIALGIQSKPDQPANWDSWNLINQQSIRSGNAYEFQYTGMKDGVKHLNFIQWFMWGDIHVQVSAEVPEFDWDLSSSVRSSLSRVLESFEPHDGSRFFTESEVMTILAQRLDDRPSGIYARDEVVRARYEMTCRQIFTDLLSSPAHLGDGVWQASANTLQGTESWRVFEPSGSIIALDSNNSRC